MMRPLVLFPQVISQADMLTCTFDLKRRKSIMIKAIFVDYTGTLVQERGVEIETVVTKICMSSSLKNPQEVLKLWWKKLKQYEENSYGDSYHTEDEIVDFLLSDFEREIQMKANKEELHSLIQKFWVNAPLFPDVPPFFEKCPYPVYVISNNGIQYVQTSLTQKNIFPRGIVCADMVCAYKPHRELFEKALEISGLNADEVIHIGDSFGSDVIGARAAGIRPILLQRGQKQSYPDVRSVSELPEVLQYI